MKIREITQENNDGKTIYLERLDESWISGAAFKPEIQRLAKTRGLLVSAYAGLSLYRGKNPQTDYVVQLDVPDGCIRVARAYADVAESVVLIVIGKSLNESITQFNSSKKK